MDRGDAITPRELDHVVRVVPNGHELRQGWVAENGVVGQRDVHHFKIEALSAIVLASPERDNKAYVAKGIVVPSVTPVNGLVGASRS